MVDRFDGPPLMQPYKNGDFVRYSDYAELEAENVRQSSDIAEFMRRLGPRWFLEQGWFPESMEASDDL